jgi:hypothetical protein
MWFEYFITQTYPLIILFKANVVLNNAQFIVLINTAFCAWGIRMYVYLLFHKAYNLH